MFREQRVHQRAARVLLQDRHHALVERERGDGAPPPLPPLRAAAAAAAAFASVCSVVSAAVVAAAVGAAALAEDVGLREEAEGR